MANPDLLVYNGKIYLRPSSDSRVEAISIRDGRVFSAGSSQEILKLKSASVDSMDLQGKVAVPGLADSHVHLLGLGMLMRTIDLSSARSIPEIQRMLARSVSTKPKDRWILGRGWDQEKLREHRYPDRVDLDVVSNPVFLRRVCGHVGVANSSALARAGIGENVLDPEGGEVARDPTGKPNGVLKERALELVSRSVPKDEKETREALVAAAERLLAQGVTALHCIVEDSVEFEALRELKMAGKIAQTIYAILPLSMLEQVGSLKDVIGRWVDGFRVGGIKFYLDGSLGARTAALVEQYTDEPGSSGMLTTSPGQLLRLVEKTRGSGLQLCAHAIGDRAAKMGLEVFEEAFDSQDLRNARHRIEHASLLSPDLIAKMASLGLVASVQPRFIFSDSWAEQRLGANRIHYLYPFKSMLQAGIHLAAGSDSPSDDPSIADGLWSAVSRPGLPPEERLSIGDALTCYTTGAAYASFSEGEEGTLEVGKWANMAVLNWDPFDCPREELRELRVVQTVVKGKVFRWN